MASKRAVLESLKMQLQQKGADIDCFADVLADYMSFWDIKNKLIRDIKERGVTYRDFSSVGVPMQKNNPSVKELVGVNRQMLSILRELGLSTERVIQPEGDEDDLGL